MKYACIWLNIFEWSVWLFLVLHIVYLSCIQHIVLAGKTLCKFGRSQIIVWYHLGAGALHNSRQNCSFLHLNLRALFQLASQLGVAGSSRLQLTADRFDSVAMFLADSFRCILRSIAAPFYPLSVGRNLPFQPRSQDFEPGCAQPQTELFRTFFRVFVCMFVRMSVYMFDICDMSVCSYKQCTLYINYLR